jgi:hypothetical protein
MRTRFRFGLVSSVLALVAALLFTSGSAHAQTDVKGQRVYSSGHSFHFFMPPILADIAKKAEFKDHKQLGLSAIGGSRVYQHWTTQTAIAKESNEAALPAETIHVASTDRFAAAGEITVQTSDGAVFVTYSGKTGKTFTGCKGGKGVLATGKKVSQEENAVRQMLKTGKVDVFTMSPIHLPDEGIENFVKLAVENNPKVRVLVQENWLPFDIYDVTFKDRPKKVDHNAATGESLRNLHAPYFTGLDDHVRELNKKYATKAVRVAPVGQAVILLREKIIAGKAPGLKQQEDLFTDAIGHARAPLQALVAYVYVAAIYERNPAGLPVPAVLAKTKDNEALNRLLQDIAWEAVSQHPLSGVKAEAKRKR